MTVRFEWNADKARGNVRKHGVSFGEAQTIFGDPLALTFPDQYHSVSEHRFITVGVSVAGRLLVVVHTERRGRIRIISCRKATTRERSFYEESQGEARHG